MVDEEHSVGVDVRPTRVDHIRVAAAITGNRSPSAVAPLRVEGEVEPDVEVAGRCLDPEQPAWASIGAVADCEPRDQRRRRGEPENSVQVLELIRTRTDRRFVLTRHRRLAEQDGHGTRIEGCAHVPRLQRDAVPKERKPSWLADGRPHLYPKQTKQGLARLEVARLEVSDATT